MPKAMAGTENVFKGPNLEHSYTSIFIHAIYIYTHIIFIRQILSQTFFVISTFFILVFGRPVVAVLGANGRTGARVVEAGCGRTNQVLLKSPHFLGAAWCNQYKQQTPE